MPRSKKAPPAQPEAVPPPAAPEVPQEPPAEIVVTEPAQLPGFGEVDSSLVDEAVAEINRIYVGKGLEMYFAVGEYVLATFFGGDPETFHARGKGHATFRALGERDDLRLSYSALYNAVAVVDQRRLLPADLTAALPFTHQKLLLPLRDESVKVDLARKAVEDDLSTRELAQEVKRVKETQREGAKLGRPNLPAFVKAFGRLKTIREQAASEPITAESFASYSPEKARMLLSDLDHWIRGLQETANQVREVLGAVSVARETPTSPATDEEPT